MVAEASTYKDAATIDVVVPTGGYTAGEVLQLCDGRAAYVSGLRSLDAGEEAALQTAGQVTMAKIADKVVLAGGKLYFDRSAGTVTPIKTSDSFFVGVAVADATAAATTVVVDLNVEPVYQVELGKTTFAASATDGLGVLQNTVGSHIYTLAFDAVAEVAMAALLSDDSVPVADLGIAEFRVAVYDKGDSAALDINWGLANATHATDADSITESVFFHVDGNATTLNAESDDGTTEVAATDTTKEAADDTYVECWIDCRDIDDIQLYVDGVNVLPDSVFKLDEATGPMKLLVHMEKTSDNTTADVRVDFARLRSTDMAS